ncbi:translocase [Lonsdalea britannica]|uniref:GtrA family protein n=1 Tax=Lonsdalea britannica TaxID=1082704 RepID=UPI000A1EE03E|nr:GtrA family protein [Lonsdalea britannica]OSN02829.1 translocase [Lonsdalea britannica]
MLKLFSRYLSVGIVNTGIHWIVFAVGVYLANLDQATSNFVAFLVAVSFSFFANAKFTFKAEATSKGYLLYVGFMSIMSLAIGKASDHYQVNPIITLIEFSAISLVCGFLFSKFVIFKEVK